MTPPSCPRLFEAEALRNGRLAGAERASYERHLLSCNDCAREARALERLARALRESYPATGDELRVRRRRMRLLEAFDRAPSATPSSFRTRARWVGLVAVVVVAAVLLLRRERPAPLTARVPAARTLIHADPAAQWSRSTLGARDRITLQRGRLWIRVTHQSPAPALLVVLPDGELEDTGTTFSVEVEGGRTARVAVEEGSVTLRLHGKAPLHLRAGESWASVATHAVSASPPTASAPPPAAAAAARSPALSASAATPSPSDAFRGAMAAFNAGRAREAAELLSRFVERYPRDPRAEDAAYVRILALRRAGDSASAREAARDYLDRYPGGFRYEEVQALAR